MQSRPQALKHNERKPSNPAAGPSALGTEPAWQSQAQREKRGCQARGQRKSCKRWGFMPHYSPGLCPESSLEPHNFPSSAQWGKQRPPHSLPCSLGHQTLQPTSASFLPNKDPAAGPGSPQSPLHTPGPMLPPSLCLLWHPLFRAASLAPTSIPIEVLPFTDQVRLQRHS